MTKPAKPTDLRAKATSTAEAQLTWSDNAVNEAEYHVEVRQAGTATWSDMGAIPPNATAITIFNMAAQRTFFFRVRAKNLGGWGAYSNEAAATTFYTTPPSCADSDTVMCLGGGRYRVEATYERGSDLRGNGHTHALSQESGLFWFFSESNVEAIVKVLDGCALNDHRWVYTTGLTDLRVLLTVVDTQTGATATYLNEGGAPFAPVNDTDALPCD